jgi:hypothetical protein
MEYRGTAHQQQASKESVGQADSTTKAQGKPSVQKISTEEQERLTELQGTDRRVRAHEQAHLAAAGNLARSGASYSLTTGPDGRLYAVGGEVQLDTAPVPDDPKATVNKMERVERAALAPADPSSQDRAVAASAAARAAQAQLQIAEQSSQESSDTQSSEGTSFKNLINVYSEPNSGGMVRGAILDLTE